MPADCTHEKWKEIFERNLPAIIVQHSMGISQFFTEKEIEVSGEIYKPIK